MPARRRKQSNAMLYTLIIFVGLFIASTTIAVIFYVNAEKYRTEKNDLRNDIDDYARKQELDDVGKDIGSRLSGKTWLGTMYNHFDDMVTLVLGGVAESTTAEVKAGKANTEAEAALKLAQEHIHIGDPNTTGLVPIIKSIVAELQNVKKLQLETQKSLDNTLVELKNVNEANTQKEQELLAQKEKLLLDIEQRKQAYKNLEDTLEKNTQEQIRNLTTQKNELDESKKDLEARLALKEAELAEAQKAVKLAKEEIAKIAPGPNPESLAFKPDGNIILVDNDAGIVHLDIGFDEHVYRGLTFTVYDRGTSIRPDGIGKAEIEVFDVEKDFSVARLIPPPNYQSAINDLYEEFTDSKEAAKIMLTLEKPYKERLKDFEEKFSKGSANRMRILNNLAEAYEKNKNKSPVILNDIVANLIWDSSKTNVIVISGEFDLDNDGYYDYDAPEKLKVLINKWGGRVENTISVDTDFLLLGQIPLIPERPSLQEQQADPMALQNYENSVKKAELYTNMQNRAQALWIPIFKYDRFLHLIGYKAQASQAGAF
ncbi:MAG: hypothetical protein JW715_05440 [Sedimentisphaerales bacterium]|nr:hypothetical protein [Sedimentisphaerales bacterium]